MYNYAEIVITAVIFFLLVVNCNEIKSFFLQYHLIIKSYVAMDYAHKNIFAIGDGDSTAVSREL